MQVLPTYGIQIRQTTGKNCSSLEVETFLSFFTFTLHQNFGKNCSFFKVNTFFDWPSHQFKKKKHPTITKSCLCHLTQILIGLHISLKKKNIQPLQNPAYATLPKCLKTKHWKKDHLSLSPDKLKNKTLEKRSPFIITFHYRQINQYYGENNSGVAGVP